MVIRNQRVTLTLFPLFAFTMTQLTYASLDEINKVSITLSFVQLNQPIS